METKQQYLFNTWDPKEEAGKWIKLQGQFFLIMNPDDDESYNDLLWMASEALTDDLFVEWFKDQVTRDVFEVAGIEVPASKTDFNAKRKEWSEEHCKEIYFVLKSYIQRLNILYELRNK